MLQIQKISQQIISAGILHINRNLLDHRKSMGAKPRTSGSALSLLRTACPASVACHHFLIPRFTVHNPFLLVHGFLMCLSRMVDRIDLHPLCAVTCIGIAELRVVMGVKVVIDLRSGIGLVSAGIADCFCFIHRLVPSFLIHDRPGTRLHILIMPCLIMMDRLCLLHPVMGVNTLLMLLFPPAVIASSMILFASSVVMLCLLLISLASSFLFMSFCGTTASSFPRTERVFCLLYISMIFSGKVSFFLLFWYKRHYLRQNVRPETQ